MATSLPALVSGIACFGVARWLVGDDPLPMRIAAAITAAVAYTLLALVMSPSLRAAAVSLRPLRLIRPKAQVGTR